MPELPEVEVICRGIAPRITGRLITAARQSAPAMRHRPEPGELAEVEGRRISGVRRRAKYMVVELEGGLNLVLHLGMTGRIGMVPAASPAARHDHLFLTLDNGDELRLNDARRFGGIWVEDADGLARLLAPLGPEPFSRGFSAGAMRKRAAGSKRAVKNMLMDNRVVVGIGNIYACEALFAAGIHPAKAAGEVSAEEWERLTAACRRVLEEAISQGGTTISDYRKSDGTPGYFQNRLKVYGRETCPACGAGIEKTVIGGRASFFCPYCQETGDRRQETDSS